MTRFPVVSLPNQDELVYRTLRERLLHELAPANGTPETTWWLQSGAWYWEVLEAGLRHRRHADRPSGLTDARPAIVDMQKVRIVFSIGPAVASWWRSSIERTTLPIHLYRGRLVFGPVFDNQKPGPCPTCAYLRLAQGFPHSQLLIDSTRSPVSCAPSMRNRLSRWITSLSSGESEELLRHLGEWHGQMTSISMANGTCGSHHVVPCPGPAPFHECADWLVKELRDAGATWRRCDLHGSTTEFRHIDDLVGPILRVRPVPAGTPDGPAEGLVGRVALVGFIGEFTTWKADVSGSGLAYDDTGAEGAAVGEAVERYSGNYVDSASLRWASEEALGDEDYLSPTQFGANARYPGGASAFFRAYDPKSAEAWTDGFRLGVGSDRNEKLWIPAEATYLNFTRLSKRKALFPVILAGVAAGRDLDHALKAAALEVVERDATMTWWYGKREAARLVYLPSSLLRKVTPQSGGIAISFLSLPSDTNIPVVGSILHDRYRRIVVTGFAARLDPSAAILKAAAEAYQLHRLSSLLLDSSSELWQEISSGRLPLPTVEFRDDRRYTGSFLHDFSDMHQLAFNLQYYLDPSAQSAIASRLDGNTDVRWADISGRYVSDSLMSVMSACESAGMELVAKELTTDDMRSFGFRVVRVLSTDLVGNAASAFPPYWHYRIGEALPTALVPPLPHA